MAEEDKITGDYVHSAVAVVEAVEKSVIHISGDDQNTCGKVDHQEEIEIKECNDLIFSPKSHTQYSPEEHKSHNDFDYNAPLQKPQPEAKSAKDASVSEEIKEETDLIGKSIAGNRGKNIVDHGGCDDIAGNEIKDRIALKDQKLKNVIEIGSSSKGVLEQYYYEEDLSTKNTEIEELCDEYKTSGLKGREQPRQTMYELLSSEVINNTNEAASVQSDFSSKSECHINGSADSVSSRWLFEDVSDMDSVDPQAQLKPKQLSLKQRSKASSEQFYSASERFFSNLMDDDYEPRSFRALQEDKSSNGKKTTLIEGERVVDELNKLKWRKKIKDVFSKVKNFGGKKKKSPLESLMDESDLRKIMKAPLKGTAGSKGKEDYSKLNFCKSAHDVVFCQKRMSKDLKSQMQQYPGNW